MLVWIEQEKGDMHPASPEALTLARRVAQDSGAALQAAVVGPVPQALQNELTRYGVERIHRVEHPLLREFVPDGYAKAIAQLVESVRPGVVTAAATDRGNEILARLAALTGLPMAANCIELKPGAEFQVVRYRWGSSLLEEAVLHGDPKLVTIATQVFQAEEADRPMPASVATFAPTLDERDCRVRIQAREECHTEGVSLKTAQVVIGGGRGVGSAEGFRVLEELAGLLGGAVGGSRVATNNGWRPHTAQIGLTGNRISPILYIACGISGAIQHLVGCRGAKHVLVINKDAEAPFFRRADFGAVGDLHEILPALIAAIRNEKSSDRASKGTA